MADLIPAVVFGGVKRVVGQAKEIVNRLGLSVQIGNADADGQIF